MIGSLIDLVDMFCSQTQSRILSAVTWIFRNRFKAIHFGFLRPDLNVERKIQNCNWHNDLLI